MPKNINSIGVVSKVTILSLIKYTLFSLSFILMFLPDISNKELAEYHFYLLGILSVMEVIQDKRISLYVVWVVGFIYIILSEMLLIPADSDYNWAVRYLLASNNTVLLGYSIARNKKMFNYKKTDISTKSYFFPFLLLFLIIYYLSISFSISVKSYYYGRQLVSTMGSVTLLGIFNKALSLILPSLIAYYVVHMQKRSKWFALVVSAPIFLLLILQSTRFILLFSMLPFFLISGFLDFQEFSIKSTVILVLVIVTLASLSQYLRTNRNELSQSTYELFDPKTDESGSFATKIANRCSPEGCVRMTYLAEKYFDHHDYTYGRSIGFIAYFWIPRSLWPNKPTQVDYWLPRYFNPNMPETASSASGFTGELRADFGYFSFIFLFLLGILLKRCNYYLIYYNYGRLPCFESIYASLLIPTTFFAVRGLNLAITTFIISVLLLKLMSKLNKTWHLQLK